MKLKKFGLFGLLILLAVALIATGCGKTEAPSSTGGGDASDKTYVFKMGMVSPPTHPFTIVSKQYADAVNEKTNGRITIEVYDSGQLGGERDLIEQVQLGTLDMALVTVGPVSNFVEDFGVFDLPFLFANREHAYAVLDGPIGTEMLGKLKNVNIKGLSFWENGFRQIYNSKRPINSPEDLKGLKFRVMENQVNLQTFRALGADPTPIAWPETYAALQQGVVDGFETTVVIFETNKMYEVQKHATIVNLFYAGAIQMINDKLYESLPKDLQDVLADLSKEYSSIQREMLQDMAEEFFPNFEKRGIPVVIDPDMEPFIKAVESVYDSYAPTYGQYYDKIKASKP